LSCTQADEINKKNPANANRNAQQRRMFESPVKQSLSQSPEGASRPAASIYSVLLVLICLA